MALDPIELVVIVGAIALLLFWGPSKIPELAKALGRARGEFSKASKESEGELEKSKERKEIPEDPLMTVALSLGISVDGKSKEQIAKDIIDKKSL